MTSTRTMIQVTSALLGMFREKIWLGPVKSKNVSKIAKFEGYNTRIRTFSGLELRTPWDASFDHDGSLERSHVAWSEYIYVHFETILGFTRNEQMGCLEAFRGNANGVKHTRNVTSHVGILRNNVFGENITRPVEVQKCRKNCQNWRLYNTRFRTFLGSEFRTSRDAS